MKGSFYVNCGAFYHGVDPAREPSSQHPALTAPNKWPDDDVLPGFRDTFEHLCVLILDIAVLVARACDKFAKVHVDDYEPCYLEKVVKQSKTTKARLLHYFPSDHADTEVSEDDSWCATHIDHGCLTGLTSAMYIDEAEHPSCRPRITNAEPLPILPSLPEAPDPSAGLYIYSRDSSLVKISIPTDCLAFQTGEALQLITQGKFKAVPHYVKATTRLPRGMKVARNTLAVFTQPNLNDIVGVQSGQTFEGLSKEVMERFAMKQA